MLKQIRKKLDLELKTFFKEADKKYNLSKLSPILYDYIKDFCLRDGKRIRPMLFVLGYLGFSKKKPANLYKSALSLELLHDFLLVHDDIIDKSALRRGKPAMHTMFNKYVKKYKDPKFTGVDLAIIAGDIIYALSIDAFLSVKERQKNKEAAFNQFIKSMVLTGTGEFIEVLLGAESLSKIKKEDIYKIYDYKTAHYTFSSPIATGCILAGANQTEVKKLISYGMDIGRAFQIRDDILGIMASEKETGKCCLADLQESKKTLILWQAYSKANNKNKATIKKIMDKQKVTQKDLKEVQSIIIRTKALDYAKKEIKRLVNEAHKTLQTSKIKPSVKKEILLFGEKILNV